MDGVLTIVDESVSAPEDFDEGSTPDDRAADAAESPVVDAAAAAAEQPAADPQVHAESPTESDGAIEITPMRVVEAILFSADTALPAAKIASILGVGDAKAVRKHITVLNAGYEFAGNAFRIEEIAGGFRMMTLPPYHRWLVKLLKARQETKLTGAAMETLAIVAYKQPCTRADIEAIRGVAAGDILNRLREMNLVKIVGRAEDIGRPLLYGTTKRFLEVFGLAGLEDLPQVDALQMRGAGDNAEPVKVLPYEGDAEGNGATAAEATGNGKASEIGASNVEPVIAEGRDVRAEISAAIRNLMADDAEDAERSDASAGAIETGGEETAESAGTAPNTDGPRLTISHAPGEAELPIEASAEFRPESTDSMQHPPPKAVVTKRTRRPRKKADPAPSDANGEGVTGESPASNGDSE